DHCVAGHHLGRVFPDPTSDPAGLSAAHARAPYRQSGKGADLYAVGQLAARRRDAWCGHRVRFLRRARRRLRHRRLDADGGHHGPGRSRRAAVGLQSAPRRSRERLFLVIELVFVAANATKLVEGGWFPLLLAGVVAFLMLTWRTGYRL